MEKDIAKIPKNPDTDIIIRVDDFGGRVGVTIREFVKSDRYTGFTKSGTKISADNFAAFKEAINSIDESELKTMAGAAASASQSRLGETSASGEKGAEKEKITEIPEEEF